MNRQPHDNGFHYCHDTALGRNNESTEIHYTALGRYNGFIYCHYRGFGDLGDPTVAQADALRAREIRSTMEVLTTSIVSFYAPQQALFTTILNTV